MESLISSTHKFVETYMSRFDSSHNHAHVLRVLALAHHIQKAEKASNPNIKYDTDLITLCCLLHDVGDKKYVEQQTQTPGGSGGGGGTGATEEFLLSINAPLELARKVQLVVSNVSYSHESSFPEQVAETIALYPELAVVQDADRLDAIGAIGIGRTFTFGAIKNSNGGMESVIRHFDEKLVKVEGRLKTMEGRRLGSVRARRISMFRKWWEEEEAVMEGDGEGEVKVE